MDVQRPPGDYITLDEAINQPSSAFYNVIGVCVDYLPPAKSRGTDYTTTFTLHDPTWERSNLGMKFRYFSKKIEALPVIQNNGDVVILRQVCTKPIQGLVGISTHSSSWVVLSGSSVSDSTQPSMSDIQLVKSAYNSPPTVQMLNYAKYLAKGTDSSSFKTPSKPTALQVEGIMREHGGQPPVRVGKRRLLQDLSLSNSSSMKFADGQPAFADLFGEVRKIHKGDYVKAEIYLTDYTSNPKLYNYDANPQNRDGDQDGYSGGEPSWKGPWGRMTIHVACWDAHATFARASVQEGMFVRIKNCQIKVDPNGSRLEAACRGDRDDNTKVNISICLPHEATNDDDFKELLRRKREYEKTAAQKGLYQAKSSENGTKKRPLEGLGENADAEVPEKLSKSKRKKNKRNAKKKAEEAPSADTITSAGTQSNQNVRCNNIEVPLNSVDRILDIETLRRTTASGNTYHLPFQNCHYKAKVRVVDYFPSNIADFAVPRQSSQYDALSDAEDDDEDQEALLTIAQSNPDAIDWEWRFMLIIEDANFQPLDSNIPKKQIPLLVAGSDAQYLLREDACNLRTHPQDLAKLKEKLFILWGDLQERKEEDQDTDVRTTDLPRSVQSQSKPFQCFIEEYGIPIPDTTQASTSDENNVPQYQRMFKMIKTAIT